MKKLLNSIRYMLGIIVLSLVLCVSISQWKHTGWEFNISDRLDHITEAGDKLYRFDLSILAPRKQELSFAAIDNIFLRHAIRSRSAYEFRENGKILTAIPGTGDDALPHGVGTVQKKSRSLYFVSSEGTDPRLNGYVYSIRIFPIGRMAWMVPVLGFLLSAIFLLPSSVYMRAYNNILLAVRDLLFRCTLDDFIGAWKNLEQRYKHAFCVLMAVNVLVFGYGMIHHAIGDHDLVTYNGIPFFADYGTGRWFQGVLGLLTFQTTSPVYAQLLTMLFQVLAAMGVVLLWYPKAAGRKLILGGLVVSLMPFVTWHHYYRAYPQIFSFPQFGMVLALLLCANQSTSRKKMLAAIVLTLISLATYNASASTYAIGWCGLLCLRLIQWDGSGKELKRIFSSLSPSIAVAVVGCLLYYLTFLWLVYRGHAISSYMTDTRGFTELLAAIPDVFYAAFRHLSASQEFFPKRMKVLLLFVIFLGFGCLAYKVWLAGRSRPQRLLAYLFAVVFMIFCSKLSFLITVFADYYAERIAQLSVPYVYLFFILAALNWKGRFIKEASTFFLILVILPYMAVWDLRAQEILVLHAQHDFATANRVLSKMESRLGGGLGGKQYTFVQLGAWKPITHRYIEHVQIPSPETRVITRFDSGLAFKRLSAEFNPKSYRTANPALADRQYPDVLRAADLSANQKPFPDDSFIGVYDDMVVLLFDEKTRDDILKQASYEDENTHEQR